VRIVADESVIVPLIASLRRVGHDVLAIREIQPGAEDNFVLDLALRANAVLITFDKDFGELIFRQKLLSSGVILVRLKGLSTITKTRIVLSCIEKYGSRLAQSFTVISPRIIRFRRI
jgi:predicted nuclease of predicted toxin-antitoxin system